jgi:hypothetical protein
MLLLGPGGEFWVPDVFYLAFLKFVPRKVSEGEFDVMNELHLNLFQQFW